MANSGTVNVVGEETSRASIRDTMRKSIDEEAIQKEIVELQKKRGKLDHSMCIL